MQHSTCNPDQPLAAQPDGDSSVLAAPAEVQLADQHPGSNSQPSLEIPGYRLIEPIGSGGYGEVWRAEAPGGLPKAVKIVFGRFDDRCAEQEGKALERISQVRHPFLLSLERIEVIDKQLVVISELADANLRERFDECVAAGRPGVPRDELLRTLAEAADALDYMAEEHGLQHLDIKPENLLLVSGHVKVADFGLVKSIHGQSMSIVGGLTPMFAAPETFDGQPSNRSDQYSLAIVYQLLLTGKTPINGQTMAQLAAQHLNARPDVSSLPEADRSIVERALSKSPFDRFPSCRAFIERLQAVRGAAVPASDEAEPAASASSTSSLPSVSISSLPEFKTDIVDVLGPATIDASATEDDGTDKLGQMIRGEVVELPAIECVGSGELQPTLFIGIGGYGANVLRWLKHRLQARLGPLEAIPSLRLLLIDSDYDGIASDSGSGEEGVLDAQQFVHAPLKPTEYYRRQASDLTRWLSRRWIYNIPKSLKIEGIRPLARLALISNLQTVEERIAGEIAEITNPFVAKQSSESLGAPVSHQQPRVFLIGSLSGGTSSGMAWDVAQLVHHALSKCEAVDPEITCVMAHCCSATAKESELSTVNTCASLTELNHYATEGCPGDAAHHLPPLGRHHGLFKDVYLLNCGGHDSDEAFDAAADVMAEYLDLNISSPTSAFTSGCRRAPAEPSRGTAGLRGFGMARIGDNDLIGTEHDARELAGEALANCWRFVANEQGAANALARFAKARTSQREPQTSDLDIAAVTAQIVSEVQLDYETLFAQVRAAVQHRSTALHQRWFGAANQADGEVTRQAAAVMLVEFEAEFPARPVLQPPKAADPTDPLLSVVTELARRKASTLKAQVGRLVDDPTRRLGAAREACEQLAIEMETCRRSALQMAEELVQKMNQLRSLCNLEASAAPSDEDSGPAPIRRAHLQKYFEFQQLHCTAGWLVQIVRVLQANLKTMGQIAAAFQARLAALAEPLAKRPLRSGLGKTASPSSADGPLRMKLNWTPNRLDQLRREVAALLEREIDKQFGSLSKLMFVKDPDLEGLSARFLAAARRRVLESFVERQVESLEPDVLRCGGARRFLVVASDELRRSGLVDLVCDKLPAEATIMSHNQPDILLLCEAQQIPLADVARNIIHNRPDLMDLAARLPTRIDVSWSPL